MSDHLTGHPSEHWSLTATGRTQHQRIWRYGVATALCDAAYRLWPDRDADAQKYPRCHRCCASMHNGVFTEVLRFGRLGQAS